ncbi:MAG: hypothetical protein KBD76_14575 [Bacteriovorax sp.]|jgi:hypothetical protein|nr:hypothetical protein [Bacteriovorax sp.]
MAKVEIKRSENEHTIVVSVEEGQCDQNGFSLHSKILERAWDIIKPTQKNNWMMDTTKTVKIELSNGHIFHFIDDCYPGSYFPNPHDLIMGTRKEQGVYTFRDEKDLGEACEYNCPPPCLLHTTNPMILGHFGFKLTEIDSPKIEIDEKKENLIPTENSPFIEHKLFSKYDETTKLWTYLEPVTKKNREYFISIIKHHGDVVLRPLYKHHELNDKIQPTFYDDDSRLIFQDDNEPCQRISQQKI